jgi:hypothetical protein
LFIPSRLLMIVDLSIPSFLNFGLYLFVVCCLLLLSVVLFIWVPLFVVDWVFCYRLIVISLHPFFVCFIKNNITTLCQINVNWSCMVIRCLVGSCCVTWSYPCYVCMSDVIGAQIVRLNNVTSGNWCTNMSVVCCCTNNSLAI